MIILHYFHTKKGANIFYSYPKKLLDEEIINNISSLIDISIDDGYIILVKKNKYIYNFYFEIYSEWARGNKEMLLLSLILNKRLSSEKEKQVIEKCYNFINNLKSNKDTFMGLYSNDNINFNDNTIKCIKNNITIKFMIKKLFIDMDF